MLDKVPSVVAEDGTGTDWDGEKVVTNDNRSAHLMPGWYYKEIVNLENQLQRKWENQKFNSWQKLAKLFGKKLLSIKNHFFVLIWLFQISRYIYFKILNENVHDIFKEEMYDPISR